MQRSLIVKRILRKYGYLPDKQGKSDTNRLEQAEALCDEWVDSLMVQDNNVKGV